MPSETQPIQDPPRLPGDGPDDPDYGETDRDPGRAPDDLPGRTPGSNPDNPGDNPDVRDPGRPPDVIADASVIREPEEEPAR
jgi:hypothetical protein